MSTKVFMKLNSYCLSSSFPLHRHLFTMSRSNCCTILWPRVRSRERIYHRNCTSYSGMFASFRIYSSTQSGIHRPLSNINYLIPYYFCYFCWRLITSSPILGASFCNTLLWRLESAGEHEGSGPELDEYKQAACSELLFNKSQTFLKGDSYNNKSYLQSAQYWELFYK